MSNLSVAMVHVVGPPWGVVIALAVFPLALIALLRVGSRPGRRTPAMWLAGADVKFVRTSTDRAFITSMGTMVALIATAAAASMTLAITLVAPGPWAWLYHLPIGVLWGLIVLTIDRWITSLVDVGPLDADEKARRWRPSQVLAMVGRVAMAVVIGLIISEPIIFKLFDSEIQNQLRAIHAHEIKVQTATLTDQYSNRKDYPVDPTGQLSTALIDDRAAQKNLRAATSANAAAQTLAICELKGAKGRPECHRLERQGKVTGDPGRGREERHAAARAEKAYARLTSRTQAKTRADAAVVAARAAVDANKAKIHSDLVAQIARMKDKVNKDSGLLAREEALDDLSTHRTAALLTRLAVWVGFMLVDLLPMLLKICTPAGGYRRLVRADAVEQFRGVTVSATERADDAAERERVGRVESFITYHDALAGEGAAERELVAYTRNLDLEYAKAEANIKHVIRLNALTADSTTPHTGQPASGAETDESPDTPNDVDAPGVSADKGIDGLDSAEQDVGGAKSRESATSGNGRPRTAEDLTAMIVGGRWLLRHLLRVPNAHKTPPWLAVDTFGQYPDEVVVKIIASASASSRDRRRAERELAMPRGFIHANLAEILDAGLDDEHGYFVVTRLFPETLQDRCTRVDPPPLTLSGALDVTEQLVLGLAAAWVRDIVHLDVKPANIGVDENGEIKLFDFGLRQRWRDRESGMTTSTIARFTPFYAPPEQMQRVKGWNERTADVRAVGAVLYWMLTGYPPLWREALRAGLITADGYFASDEAPLRTKALIARTDPTPAGQLLPGLPRIVDRLLGELLERDPAQRNPGHDTWMRDSFADRLVAKVRATRAEVEAGGFGAMLVGRAAAPSPRGADVFTAVEPVPGWENSSGSQRFGHVFGRSSAFNARVRSLLPVGLLSGHPSTDQEHAGDLNTGLDLDAVDITDLRSLTADDLPPGDWETYPFPGKTYDTEATDLGPAVASDDRLPDDLARYDGTVSE